MNTNVHLCAGTVLYSSKRAAGKYELAYSTHDITYESVYSRSSTSSANFSVYSFWAVYKSLISVKRSLCVCLSLSPPINCLIN